MTAKGVQDLIEKSGGDLPHEVADVLSKNGWVPQIGPHYIDIATGKTREIDIVARKAIDVRDDFYGGREKILIRLFIECKNLESEYLLHFTPRDKEKATSIIKDNAMLRHEEHLDLTGNHYFSEKEVAKTWSTKGRDDFYDAWIQSVHSMIYFSTNQNEGHYVLDLPIVVLRSFENLYKREKTEEGYSPIKENFQLEVDYSYPLKDRNVSKTFLVDFVSLEGLPDFLNISLKPDISLARMVLVSELSKRAFEQRQAEQRRRNSGDSPFGSSR